MRLRTSSTCVEAPDSGETTPSPVPAETSKEVRLVTVFEAPFSVSFFKMSLQRPSKP